MCVDFDKRPDLVDLCSFYHYIYGSSHTLISSSLRATCKSFCNVTTVEQLPHPSLQLALDQQQHTSYIFALSVEETTTDSVNTCIINIYALHM